MLKKRWFRALFRQRVYVAILILMQLGLILAMTLSSLKRLRFMSWVLGAISVLAVLYIVKKNDKPAYKLTWVMLILIFPLFGGLFYLLFRIQSSPRHFCHVQGELENQMRPLMELTGCHEQPDVDNFGNLPSYLRNYLGFPIYVNTCTTYLSPGEKMFDELMRQLRSAKRYIFLEYFIIGTGAMWNAILGVLKEKAAAGVEVRLLYDDMGCFLRLPTDYPQTLGRFGISCRVFGSFKPVLSTLQNNRDHRKIAVIDGLVAFTGGINLSDEYINAADRFGHWKDSAIMLRGDGAWGFTMMFLEMWRLSGAESESYRRFLPERSAEFDACRGHVQPYCDSPLDHENVGEHVYRHIINNARRYLYINTPYLIVDESMLSALTLAAKSGVDVRICTPQRWDKRLVHMTTRSYYRTLIKAGVKVYEYRGGFVHSKTFVADDIVATVGTTNLDFRSLYLHFECGCCLYNTNSVLEVKNDFIKTLERCVAITPDDCKASWFGQIVQEVLRIFAPLM